MNKNVRPTPESHAAVLVTQENVVGVDGFMERKANLIVSNAEDQVLSEIEKQTSHLMI